MSELGVTQALRNTLHRIRAACSRNFPLGCWIACFWLQPLSAQPTIERYLPEVSGFRFEKIEVITALEGHNQLGPFTPPVLSDYLLASYSRWRVGHPGRIADTTGTQVSEMEVYEMQDPSDAFGIFSLWDKAGRHLNLPVENLYRDGQLVFWRGSYFFHLTGPSQESLKKLSVNLIQVIPQINIYPLTVVHLPRENLVMNSIRFYAGNSSFALAQDFPQFLVSHMGFQDKVEVARAQYSPGGHSLFLIGYPTAALAADYFLKLQNALRDYFSPQGIYMKRAGVIVSIFLGPETVAQQILAQVEYAPSVQWVYEKTLDPEKLEKRRGEVITFLGLVTNSFIATFFFMALTFCGGAIAGLVRYKIINRYPGAPSREETIRLRIEDY